MEQSRARGWNRTQDAVGFGEICLLCCPRTWQDRSYQPGARLPLGPGCWPGVGSPEGRALAVPWATTPNPGSDHAQGPSPGTPRGPPPPYPRQEGGQKAQE